MNITIIDGYTVNPNDLSWESINQLGNLSCYDRTSPDKLLERCENANVIITKNVFISAELMDKCPHLQMITITATGFNCVDTEAAKQRNIIVCNVPDYSTNAVAQHTFSLLLELSNSVGKYTEGVRNGNWSKSIDFCYQLNNIYEIAGKTLGIVGYGNIGKKVGQIAKAFDMTVIFCGSRNQNRVGETTIENLFSQSDFITLHCPQTTDNKGFVNASLLNTMKPSSFLINTARGTLINENDLADALNKGILAGAGLDVLSQEPPSSSHSLINAKNCLITPHIAWISYEARQRIIDVTTQNIKGLLSGNIINQVNK